MSSEEKPPTQPLLGSLSDSVDLAEFLAAKQPLSPGWLDAMNRGQSPHAQPASARNATAATPPNPNQNKNASTAPHTTQGSGSTLSAHTPSTSRYSADVTAMGSPIPVDTDDSNANINQLISRLGSRDEDKQGEAPIPFTAAAPSATTTGGGVAGPRYRATPPPAPTPTGAGACVSHPAAREDTNHNKRDAASAASAPTSAAASAAAQRRLLMPPPTYASPSRAPGSLNDIQNSPFGESYCIRSGTEQTTLLPRRSDLRDTTMATDNSPHPSTYSSALMQALSRSEGAAVLTSQWTSNTHPSRTYTNTEDHEDSAGSSAYPADIYEEAMRAKVAKQQWMALERARQEVLEEARRRRDCPFAPQVSPYAARLRRPASLRPENRVRSEMIRRKQWLAKKQQQEVERELRECTFRPLTVRAAQLEPAALTPAGPVVFHNLYAEAEDRRAFEAEVKPQLIRQVERRVQPSPMRQEQMAEVVERLCARGVVRTAESAPREEGATDVKAASPTSADPHQPLLAAVSQRIVAAQIATGERDPDIVRHLYRQAERDAMKDQLRHQLDEEKDNIARAEQAMVLAQDRRRLQQEYYRSLLAAKYRALSRHVSEAQHASYRPTAPQSVALLGRASFDLLSTDETEELLSAVEHCGQHKLREAEFVAVVFRYFAEKQVVPANTALLTRSPPVSAVVGNGAANAKRASSDPRIGSSMEGSPLNLPKVKREKPDPEVIAQIRENRAQALEEWKREHQHKRAVAEGIVADEEYPFQPAPRRLIPYACRPDVVVPVKMTKSEVLRRAHIAMRQQETNAPAVPSPALKANASFTRSSTSAAEQAGTAHELFSRSATASGVSPRARSRSGAAATAATAAVSGTAERERSAAGSGGSPAPRSQSRAACAQTRRLSRSPPQTPPPKVGQQTAPPAAKLGNVASAVYRAPVSQPSTSKAQSRWPSQEQQQVPICSSAMDRDTVPKSTESTSGPRRNLSVMPTSLVEQIMQSTPQERARLGRELLLRQLRDHQRRRFL